MIGLLQAIDDIEKSLIIPIKHLSPQYMDKLCRSVLTVFLLLIFQLLIACFKTFVAVISALIFCRRARDPFCSLTRRQKS